jgi:hypothetical protein
MDNVAAYHNVDPVNGYLETSGNYATPFDSERKKAFLEVYKQHELGIRKACRSMGLSVSTVNHHLQIDPKFKEDFDEAEREYIENLECVSRTNALNPKAVIERIFQLKCLLPSKYGQFENKSEPKVTINISSDVINEAKRRCESMERAIDAEIVRETDGLKRVSSASMGENGGNNDPERGANT